MDATVRRRALRVAAKVALVLPAAFTSVGVVGCGGATDPGTGPSQGNWLDADVQTSEDSAARVDSGAIPLPLDAAAQRDTASTSPGPGRADVGSPSDTPAPQDAFVAAIDTGSRVETSTPSTDAALSCTVQQSDSFQEKLAAVPCCQAFIRQHEVDGELPASSKQSPAIATCCRVVVDAVQVDDAGAWVAAPDWNVNLDCCRVFDNFASATQPTPMGCTPWGPPMPPEFDAGSLYLEVA